MNFYNIKYSIIVPVYKVEKYLSECIESILSQTFTKFELIIVDDGSPDNCGLICDEFQKRDKRIKVIHKENGGRLSAWLAGLNIAQGEYIGSVDGDDYIDSELLLSIDDSIKACNPDIVVFGYKSVDDYHNVINKYLIDLERGFYDKEQIADRILPTLINRGTFENRSCIYLSRINKFLKADLIKQNYKYYLKGIEYGEDNLWTIPNVITANSIFILSDLYSYNYRQNSSSITHTINAGLWNKFVALDRFTIQILRELGKEDMIDQVYCDGVFHAAVSINNVVDSDDMILRKRQNIARIIRNEYVIKGVTLMDQSRISTKEKINVFLIKNKLTELLLLSKIIQNKFKSRRLKKNDDRK